MNYRTLGRTGLRVSEIGIGTEHVVSHPQKHVTDITARAVDGGINYFDFFWPNRDFREKMGNAFSGIRNKVIINGHLGVSLYNGQYARSRDKETCREDFHDLLKQMKTDYIDVMMLHYVDEQSDLDIILGEEFMGLAQELKKQGKARHIGMSSHQASVARMAAESGLIDVIMFSINPAFDVLGHISSSKTDADAACLQKQMNKHERNGMLTMRKDFYNLCAREEVALVAMKAFAGGWLLSSDTLKGKPTSHQCLNYVLSQPGVAAAVPGVQTIEELEDVLRFSDASREEKDYSEIIRNNHWDLEGSCLYCNHCLPCPVQINIGETIKLLDNAKHGLTDSIHRQYEQLTSHAGDCIGCGDCMTQCPFKVDVITRMKEAADIFGR